MKSRAMAAAEALGSTRAEGLAPSQESLLIIEQWVQGEISDDELEKAKRHIIEVSTVHPVPSSQQ